MKRSSAAVHSTNCDILVLHCDFFFSIFCGGKGERSQHDIGHISCCNLYGPQKML